MGLASIWHCEYCGNWLKLKEELKDHIITVHIDAWYYSCFNISLLIMWGFIHTERDLEEPYFLSTHWCLIWGKSWGWKCWWKCWTQCGEDSEENLEDENVDDENKKNIKTYTHVSSFNVSLLIMWRFIVEAYTKQLWNRCSTLWNLLSKLQSSWKNPRMQKQPNKQTNHGQVLC